MSQKLVLVAHVSETYKLSHVRDLIPRDIRQLFFNLFDENCEKQHLNFERLENKIII